jgi:hypothetical protein
MDWTRFSSLIELIQYALDRVTWECISLLEQIAQDSVYTDWKSKLSVDRFPLATDATLFHIKLGIISILEDLEKGID